MEILIVDKNSGIVKYMGRVSFQTAYLWFRCVYPFS